MSDAVALRRWWGWGEREVHVPDGLLQLLRDECGMHVADAAPRVRDVAAVQVPPFALSNRLQRRLVAATHAGAVRRDHETRVLHATGRSYLDLLRLRSGVLDAAPDAVVHARSAEEVARVLRVCADGDCAVVPFGGGTSVVGGVTPDRGTHASVIALALRDLAGEVAVDAMSRLASIPAGMTGPEVDAILATHGLTLGHVPQSYEQATIGGYAATRSAGQASSGYGRFDEMVRGMRAVTPAGRIDLAAAPPEATGPSMLEMLLGAEGTLGVITEVTARVRPQPAFTHVAGWSFAGFEPGCAALRELAQRDLLPDIVRLSDAEETRVTFAAAAGRATRLAQRYLRALGQPEPCVAVLGWEGDAADVGRRVRAAEPALRRHGARALGTAPGRAWRRGRFDGPYLRDALLDRGVLAETIETSGTWRDLQALHDALTTALRDSLRTPSCTPLVGVHVSHVYPEGASLYATVLAPQDVDDSRGQWLRAKAAATDAILAAGGSLSHHHGVGRDHAPWLAQRTGALGVAAVRALRDTLDPAHVMNPGALTR